MIVLQLAQFDTGGAIVLIGIMAMLLWVSYALSNISAVVMWAIAALILILVLTFSLPMELFYLALIFTAIAVLIGIMVRL